MFYQPTDTCPEPNLNSHFWAQRLDVWISHRYATECQLTCQSYNSYIFNYLELRLCDIGVALSTEAKVG